MQISNAIIEGVTSRPVPKPAGVIVMGADYAALGVVRSFGRRGIPVILLKRGDQRIAAWSTYVSRVLRWPDDTNDLDFLLRLADTEKLRGWLIMPLSDDTVGLVARGHEDLAARYTLATSPWTIIERVCNKRVLYEFAQTLGIDHPWTYCPKSSQELETLDCPFPVIIKPALREASNPLTLAKAWRVNSRQELQARYLEASRYIPGELLMLQEIVPGGGESQFSYAALCSEGQVMASLVARRTRQYPADFGRASTFVETIQDPGISHPATRLLAAVGLTGLVELEFKRDPSGRYKLLDVNPRVWGWHTLCARAGVDFPYLLWLMAQGDTVPQVEAAPGISWMRLSSDLPVALQEIVCGRLSLKKYIQTFFGPLDSAIFAIDDPVPGLLELLLIGYLVAKRYCGAAVQDPPVTRERAYRLQ